MDGDVNRRTVCDFIKAKMPDDGQLVLALVDASGVDFGGSVVELTKKRAVLNRADYRTIGHEVEALLLAMYNAATEADL